MPASRWGRPARLQLMLSFLCLFFCERFSFLPSTGDLEYCEVPPVAVITVADTLSELQSEVVALRVTRERTVLCRLFEEIEFHNLAISGMNLTVLCDSPSL